MAVLMGEVARSLCRRAGITREHQHRRTLTKHEMQKLLVYLVSLVDEIERLQVALKHSELWEETKRDG